MQSCIFVPGKKKKRYFTRGPARSANLAYCTAIISCYILIIIVNLIRNTTTMCFYNLHTIRRPEGEENLITEYYRKIYFASSHDHYIQKNL